MHAARHTSKKGRDTLPGLCRGGLEALFCHPAQQIEDCTCTNNSYHEQHALRGTLDREKGCQAWAKPRRQNGRTGVLWAPRRSKSPQPACYCMGCMGLYGPLFAVSSPIGGGRAVPVTCRLRWTHAHVRCAARSQITIDEAFSHFCH